MLNILIVLIAGVTLAMMTTDPRASTTKVQKSAWQQTSSPEDVQKSKLHPKHDTEQF